MVMVSDADDATEILPYCLSQEQDYRAALLIKTAPRFSRRRPARSTPQWFLRFVVAQVLSFDWKALGDDALNSAYAILSYDRVDTQMAARQHGMSEEAAKLLSALFSTLDMGSPTDGPTEPERRGGFLMYVSTGNEELNPAQWSSDTLVEAVALGGVLQASVQMMLCGYNQSPEDVSVLEVILDNDVSQLSLLPESLQTHFIDMSVDLTDANIGHILRRHHIGKKVLYSYSSETVTPGEWPAIVRAFPSLVSLSMSRRFVPAEGRHLEEWIASDLSTEPLRDLLKSGLLTSSFSVADAAIFVDLETV